MKKSIVFKSVYLLWLLCLVSLLGACQKENDTDNESNVPLSSIPENPEYAKLPLIGTTWQLIGFANAKTERIKKVKIKQDNSYTLSFTEIGEIWGYTSVNTTKGKYELFDKVPNKILISEFAAITYLHEMDDVENYEVIMNQVNRFKITPHGLALYYDLDNYLLFKPVMD